MGKTFTTQDVAAHDKPNDLYIVVDEDVYDLTQFQDEHPGKSLSTIVRRQKLTMHFCRRKEDPHPDSRKRCLEAILEIPQRRYSQEIQIETTSRLPQYQEGCPRAITCTSKRKEGDRETQSGERGCGSRSCCRGGRDVGSVWGFDPFRGPKLVSRCMSPFLSVRA